MTNGLWNLWSQVLDRAGEAADGSRNTAERAWVLHQQGTRALLAGEFDRARGLLGEALDIRRRSDEAAVGRTEQNLDVLRIVTAPPLSLWQRLGPRGQLLLATAVLVTAIGALFWFGGIADAVRGYLSPSATPAAPTAPPSPPATPAPTPVVTPSTAPLDREITFAATEVLPNGDWRGVATVTPTGGTPPYRIRHQRRDAGRRRDGSLRPVRSGVCSGGRRGHDHRCRGPVDRRQ